LSGVKKSWFRDFAQCGGVPFLVVWMGMKKDREAMIELDNQTLRQVQMIQLEMLE
jgi:hypothetical protein